MPNCFVVVERDFRQHGLNDDHRRAAVERFDDSVDFAASDGGGADDQAVGHDFGHDDHLLVDLLDRRDQFRRGSARASICWASSCVKALETSWAGAFRKR